MRVEVTVTRSELPTVVWALLFTVTMPENDVAVAEYMTMVFELVFVAGVTVEVSV